MNSSGDVFLSAEDIRRAIKEIGDVRYRNSRQAGYRNRSGLALEVRDPRMRRLDAGGACGEVAFARWLGLPWRPTVWPTPSDVHGLHVRWTDKPTGGLLVRPRDPDTGYYVLVVGQLPSDLDAVDAGRQFSVKGWMVGTQAKQRHWYHEQLGGRKSPTHLVPQDQLWSLWELEKIMVWEMAKRAPE